MASTQMPTYKDILWPTLKALAEKGGSASNQELSEVVAKEMGLPDDILDVPHKDGPLSEFDYRAAWARTHLKMIDAVENSERGVWAITDIGRRIDSDRQVRQLVKDKRAERRKAKKQATAVSDDSDDAADGEVSWEEELLEILRGLDSSSFERLCQRMLRESGFIKVEVTGR
jgi:restriction system protein